MNYSRCQTNTLASLPRPLTPLISDHIKSLTAEVEAKRSALATLEADTTRKQAALAQLEPTASGSDLQQSSVDNRGGGASGVGLLGLMPPPKMGAPSPPPGSKSNLEGVHQHARGRASQGRATPPGRVPRGGATGGARGGGVGAAAGAGAGGRRAGAADGGAPGAVRLAAGPGDGAAEGRGAARRLRRAGERINPRG